MSKAFVLAGLTLPLIACVALSAPIEALRRTPTPSPTTTASPTLSATPSPSATPIPTETSTETPTATPEPLLSATPTLLLPPLSPAPTVPNALDCKLVWQSPRNNVTFTANQSFGAGWKVINNGSSTWNPNSVIFTYLGGAKMYDSPLVQLKGSVASGQSVVLSVHMKAPRNPDRYTTYWSLRQGNIFFCIQALSIYVEK
jgi:hypothetical protein